MPASNWHSPPYANAGPMTRLGDVSPRVPILIKPNTKVVKAKAHRPRGAGLANLRSLTAAYVPGWNSPPNAGSRDSSLPIWARGP